MNEKTGAELIAAERQRQIGEEGWSPEHDDKHFAGTLCSAGGAYAIDAALEFTDVLESMRVDVIERFWPWDGEWWKPTPRDPVRQLVKAGALIAAEIDRLRRAAS